MGGVNVRLPYAYVGQLGPESERDIYNAVNKGKKYHQVVEPAREVIKRAFHNVFPGAPVGYGPL